MDLFTADYIDREDAEILSSICAGCDLIILCRRYAEREKPPTGYWAGKRYGANIRPKSTKAA
ncbi:hypothetical protein ACPW96_20250 [Micromonospora sp. DT81.3]|uniref:hypothetical protein n=1 Tax=Micromonospora sp. DT81.3 TaxID=3416523 RepID=UPI003CF5EBED